MLNEYRHYSRHPRIWGESDQHYHRRVASAVQKERIKNDIMDLDAYVLGRMYDFVGHVIRMGNREPNFLPYIAMCHRDKAWCQQHQDIIRHQGHPGRVHPWTHEKAYHDYFSNIHLEWKQVALDKTLWFSHKNHWLYSIYGY